MSVTHRVVLRTTVAGHENRRSADVGRAVVMAEQREKARSIVI
jgi:hypothetical protein